MLKRQKPDARIISGFPVKQLDFRTWSVSAFRNFEILTLSTRGVHLHSAINNPFHSTHKLKLNVGYELSCTKVQHNTSSNLTQFALNVFTYKYCNPSCILMLRTTTF